MKFEPKKSGLLDLDAFYAAKTQLDALGPPGSVGMDSGTADRG